MKVIISGYGRMGHIIEGVLLHKGIELVCATEDVCATPPEVARECVCIDFTTPAAYFDFLNLASLLTYSFQTGSYKTCNQS